MLRRGEELISFKVCFVLYFSAVRGTRSFLVCPFNGFCLGWAILSHSPEAYLLGITPQDPCRVYRRPGGATAALAWLVPDLFIFFAVHAIYCVVGKKGTRWTLRSRKKQSTKMTGVASNGLFCSQVMMREIALRHSWLELQILWVDLLRLHVHHWWFMPCTSQSASFGHQLSLVFTVDWAIAD